MQIENPKLDERHNPNITHEPASRELWRLLVQVGLLLLILFGLARALAWGIDLAIRISAEPIGTSSRCAFAGPAISAVISWSILSTTTPAPVNRS